ncbi:hypothetical protein GOQ29_02455 [Clostridium sp. D2Q-14]|uniref:hypothetical protein n=1 Tax=Anaeromonas gelatinilytica TaxID=2683194 RepID=UPI00193B4E64|nr:hypothetical protein [Anaeromonas gelatinilytica]MBS4534470.1 hypothetical protein [Anaeromonas gelatinilytica]
MNNEEKIYDLLEKVYTELQETKNELNSFRKDTNKRFDTLEDKVDSVSNKLDDVEASNANRHIIINSKLEKINKNISTVEEVTAKNWTDIIELKKIK